MICRAKLRTEDRAGQPDQGTLDAATPAARRARPSPHSRRDDLLQVALLPLMLGMGKSRHGESQPARDHLYRMIMLLERSLIQAGSARTIQLKHPGLFRCLFQGLPTGGNPWHESFAALALQNRFARGIVRIDGDECLSNFFDQYRIQVAVRRE